MYSHLNELDSYKYVLSVYCVLGALLMPGDMAVGKTRETLPFMEKMGEGKQRNKSFIQGWCPEENKVR